MFDLSFIHEAWRFIHIAIGFVGLFAFWVPVFAKKGSALHVRAGTVFAICGYIVAGTALISSFWALAAPVQFFTSRGVPAGEASAVAADSEFLFAILFFLAMGVLVGLRTGVRLVRTKHQPEAFATPSLKAMHVVYGLAGAALLGYGIVHMITEGVSAAYIFCAVLGTIGIIETPGSLRFLANPRPTKMAWWYKHMESMIGCGVAFHTAFFLFGFSRVVNAGLLPSYFVLFAIFLPAAIGIPATSIWIRHYKRRFQEAGA